MSLVSCADAALQAGANATAAISKCFIIPAQQLAQSLVAQPLAQATADALP
jgi:hypothetical protein